MSKKITSATHIGLRPYQEDKFVVKRVDLENLSGTLMAVMDGHGGAGASSYVKSRLEDDLFDKSLIYERGHTLSALKKVFESLNAETSKSMEYYSSGTTLSAVYVPDGQSSAYVGVIGDSPVIFVEGKTADIRMSPEHNIRSNDEERKATIGRGGVIQGGYLIDPSSDLGLQMSRDIGYHGMGKILSRQPDVYSLEMSEGDALVICTDGLLDPGHGGTSEEARRLAKLVLGGAEASDLVQDALRRHTGDNVTVIVYRA